MTASTTVIRTTSRQLLSSLCGANHAILNQKKHLLDILNIKFGVSQAKQFFSQPCTIVGASIGQHYRHSMDHLELALDATCTAARICSEVSPSNELDNLHYDVRIRGGDTESNVEEARKRIDRLLSVVQNVESSFDSNITDCDTSVDTISPLPERRILASFFLSADPQEFQFNSTIGRELGFAVHHAIHHMAMVRIIAVETVGLEGSDIPMDLGKAPSTIQFEN